MDVSKYHTRFPPREHEEAVRMLLEGLESGPQQQNRADMRESEPILRAEQRTKRSSELEAMKQTRRMPTGKRPVEKRNFSACSSSSVDSGSLARCSAGEHEDEELFEANKQIVEKPRRDLKMSREDLHFNSEGSASSREFIESIQPAKSLNGGRQVNLDTSYEYNNVLYPLPNMQSKATSTGGSDSISTSGASCDQIEGGKRSLDGNDDDDLNGNYEAIPNRTIAIQCDLKLSSVKRNDGGLDSNSSDLASMQASSISSTRYGFYRLSSEMLEQRRQLARSVSSRNIAELSEFNSRPAQLRRRRSTVEAPTSISELSSTADANELELARERQRSLSQGPLQAAAELRSATGSSDRDSISARSKYDQRFFSQRQRQQQLISRARRDSLPRRPKTALSLVSTSKLRHQANDDELCQSDEENNLNLICNNEPQVELNRRQTLLRNRAMSQQVLSSSNKQRSIMANDDDDDNDDDGQPTAELANGSNSDSELGAEGYRVPQLEEMVVTTRRGRVLGGGGSSPQVARRNYAVRDGPLFRRATATSTTSLSRDFALNRPILGRDNVENNTTTDLESLNYERHYEQQLSGGRQQPMSNRAPVRPNYSTTDDENQLASEQRRAISSRAELVGQRAVQRNGGGIGPTGKRFASMSLTRRPQLAAKLIDQSSCDPSNQSSELKVASGKSVAETESSYSDQNHEPITRAFESRQRFRARSQQQQRPPTTALNRTNQRPKLTTDRANSRRVDGQAVGRSSSMKQSNRMVMADEDTEQQVAERGRVEFECKRCFGEGETCCNYNSASGRLSRNEELNQVEEPVERRQRLAAEPKSEPADEVGKRPDSDEGSESPLTRTWANPAHVSRPGHLDEIGLEDSSLEYAPAAEQEVRVDLAHQTNHRPLDRKSLRSHSMRDANSILDQTAQMRPRRFETIYRAGQQQEQDFEERRQMDQRQRAKVTAVRDEECSLCSSSLENESGRARLESIACVQAQSLDFDSQQRLNEIGLPEPADQMTGGSGGKRSASHLGLSSMSSGLINRYATNGQTTGTLTNSTRDNQLQHHSSQHLDRDHQHHQYSMTSRKQNPGPAITGRAMSQQSLTRPTMPLSRRLRRSGGTIGAGSGGSEMGGSSISLVSRLRDGSRYENAHTRNPIVMLIPQVTATSSSRNQSSESLRASSRRASSRLSSRPLTKVGSSRNSSQDRRGHRSLSRNGSDSESSSSMMRTLIKPRPVGSSQRSTETRSSRRYIASTRNKLDSDEENLDEIGQLASELDSYKFRRRYSVPKDAKINWFSKLKQRVTSSKS